MGAFTASGAKIWPVPPDWAGGVTETLAWATDVSHASATAVSQHRALRTSPRRSFSFEVMANGQNRRVTDMLLAGHGGKWLLPIWPDVQRLPGGPASALLPCRTAGFDFVEGGKALLYRGVNDWQVVEISAIAPDHLVLAAPPLIAFTPGMRLYPLRSARLKDGAQETLGSDSVSRRSITFDIDEVCDWPALPAGTTYRTHPVLELRPDESDSPTADNTRMAQTVDNGTGRPFVHDLPGIALRAQQSHWKLHGRERQAWFRSLLYRLQGRFTPIWVPSFASDLKPAAAIAGGSTSLSIEWAGYTLFGKGKHNRKDVRIELTDGAVLYRRITNAVEAGDTETLTLDSFLSSNAIASGAIRQISFMALATLASDEVELEHMTDADGTAKTTTGWQAVVPDV